jgi:hypothetical protein
VSFRSGAVERAREARGRQWDTYLDTGDISYDALEIVEDGDCGRGTRVEAC